MLALVIDTSSAAVTAAVVRFTAGAETGAAAGLQVLAERVTVNARGHAELLAPAVAACLREAGTAPRELDAVIAGLGPGPFTGLRVGLVTAAAIADAVGRPTYGECSLDAIAAEIGHPGPLLVAGDARRREVYWATYEAAFAAGGKRRSGPDVARAAEVAPAAEVAQQGSAAMAGAGARLYRDQLELTLLDVDYPTARGLARLAADRVLAGAPSETLVPLYLRRPDAVAATSFKAVTR